MKETLTCTTCSKKWKRERSRGRKPHLCPSCIKQTAPVKVSKIETQKAKKTRAVPAKKISTQQQPLEMVASNNQSSSKDGDITVGQVFAAYHPRHPKADELIEQTKGGSVWRCTHCKKEIKLHLPVTAPPTHKCSDSGKSKTCERIS